MKKILLSILILIVVFTVACQQAAKQGVMEKKTTEAPKTQTTGDAAVDAVGKDLSNVNSVEKDLNTDGLNDLDSGLGEVENI